MRETQSRVIAILERRCSIKPERLRGDTIINKDLGVDGDDAVDLLKAIQGEFDINVSDFEFSKYFGPESIGIIQMIKHLVRGQRPKFDSLSVHDLADYVDRKRR
jgi:acyl carrier protein